MLTDDRLYHCVGREIVHTLSKLDILDFIRTTPPVFVCRPLIDMPLVLGNLLAVNGRIGLTTNMGLLFLSNSLNPEAYIQESGMVTVALLPTNELLFSTIYSMTRLFGDAGFGELVPFPTEIPDNARNVTHSCTINDSLQLLSSYSAQFYLYNMKRREFKCLEDFGSLK